MTAFIPARFKIDNPGGFVEIVWQDGHVTQISIKNLRGHCPCALCQGHQSEFRYQENSVSGIHSAKWIGRYAVNFHFSDGHNTGIFRLEALRKMDPSSSEGESICKT